MPGLQAFQVDLSDDERASLHAGLLEWWGPTEPTDELASAMGFTDRHHLSGQVRRLMTALEERQPLTLEGLAPRPTRH